MNQLDEKQIQGLQRLLSLLDPQTLTKEDFIKAFEEVIKTIKALQTRNDQEMMSLDQKYTSIVQQMKSGAMGAYDSVKTQAMDMCQQEMKKLMDACDAQMAKMDEKMLSIVDGKDADEEAMTQKVISDVQAPILDQIEKKLPQLGVAVRDGLELLTGEERLDASAIKGLEQIKVAKDGKVEFRAGQMGMALYVNGVKKGRVRAINLVPGSGISMVYNAASGRNDITISASGTALSLMTATGAVDGANTSFVFASKPVIIISDGVSLQDTKGWTWTALTLTAVLDVPPNFDLYGI